MVVRSRFYVLNIFLALSRSILLVTSYWTLPLILYHLLLDERHAWAPILTSRCPSTIPVKGRASWIWLGISNQGFYATASSHAFEHQRLHRGPSGESWPHHIGREIGFRTSCSIFASVLFFLNMFFSVLLDFNLTSWSVGNGPLESALGKCLPELLVDIDFGRTIGWWKASAFLGEFVLWFLCEFSYFE